MGINNKSDRFSWNSLSLILIVTANICFYTKEMLNYYTIMTISGIIISILVNVKHFSFKIKSTNCILWLVAVYSMYFIYGLLFLSAGTFPWDSLLIRFAENAAIYISIKGLFYERGERILAPFIITGIVSAIYLFTMEKASILSGGMRIGDSLSGNVNTVGFNFGFILLLVTWNYCKFKKKTDGFLLLFFIIIMLLTGSKKALLIIVLDLVMILIYEKEKATTWLWIAIVASIGVYVIFNVSYFYEILGIRIETMLATMIGGRASALGLYSYSTDMREVMLKEAFSLFLTRPVFGGGYNYFFANTTTQYAYSHSNYTELLCSFGIIGTLLYYSKQLANLKYLIRERLYKNSKTRNIGIVCLILMIEMLMVDWATVTFSGQCMGYIPILFTSAALDYLRDRERDSRIIHAE